MKKISVTLLCAILCISLGGCMFKNKSRVERFSEEMESEKGMADNMMENIAEALDNEDAEALKELYADPAIEATPDLDEQIDALIDYYQGNMNSYKGTIHSSISYESGSQTMELDGLYELVSEKATYQIFFIQKPVDDINPDKIGLYMVEFTTQEEYDKEVEANGYYDWKHKNTEAGAYFSYSDVK